MTEDWLREELADVASDEPPLWLDIDEVVTAGRRRTTRRRALLGATVLTATVAALATVLPVMLAPDHAPPAVGGTEQAPPVTSAPLRPGDPDSPPGYTREGYQEVAEMLLERLRLALPAMGSKLAGEEADMDIGPPSDNTDHYLPGSDQQSWTFIVTLKHPVGPYSLWITASSSATGSDPPSCPGGGSPPPGQPMTLPPTLDSAGAEQCESWGALHSAPWYLADAPGGYQAAGTEADEYRRVTVSVLSTLDGDSEDEWGEPKPSPLTESQLLALCRDLVAGRPG
jgi:hypothetical protein